MGKKKLPLVFNAESVIVLFIRRAGTAMTKTVELKNSFIYDSQEAKILETLLVFFEKQTDAEHFSRSLLESYGSLPRVLKANLSLLKKEGLSHEAAVFLKTLNAAIRIYYTSNLNKPSSKIDSMALKQLLLSKHSTLEKERLIVFLFNSRGDFIGEATISMGNFYSVEFKLRNIYEIIFSRKACSVVLAHNHPSGDCTPSAEDIRVTSKLKQSLSSVDVTLTDHYIIGKNQIYSILNTSYL